jgi:hypothetical protein
MTNIYKITRWDPMLIKNNLNPYPSIAIIVDNKFKKFANKNSNILLFKFFNTKGLYDDKKIVGIVNDKFIFKDGSISILLDSEWYGYPDYNGECEIVGLKHETRNKIKYPDYMSTIIIVIIFFIIFIIFLTTLFLK